MDLLAGDVIFIQSNPETGSIQLAKAINPLLEQMARDAIAEYGSGRTMGLDEALQLVDHSDPVGS